MFFLKCGGPLCARYTMHAVNILLLILACVTFGYGVWIRNKIAFPLNTINPVGDERGHVLAANHTQYNSGISKIRTTGNLFITAAVFVILAAGIGFWAAHKSSKVGLISYIVILDLAIVLQLAAGIDWSVKGPQVADDLLAEYRQNLPFYDFVQTRTNDKGWLFIIVDQVYDESTAPSTKFVNMIQTLVGCCGYENGYTDFQGTPYWRKGHTVPPVFCCPIVDSKNLTAQLEDRSCEQTRTPLNSWMNVGCATRVRGWLAGNSSGIVGTAVSIGLIDLLGVAAASYQYHVIVRGSYQEF